MKANLAAAAEEVASYENRLITLDARMLGLDARMGALESRMTMLLWAIGTNIAATLGVLFKLLH